MGLVRISAALLLTAALAAGLAACGGDGAEATEGEEFAAAADRICVEAAKRDIATRAGADDTATYLRQLRADRRGTLRQLAALDPGEASQLYEDYLDRRRRAVERIGEGLEALRSGEDAEFERFRAAARERVLAAERVAAELGLSACAGKLAAADRAAVENSIAVSFDPSRAREFCVRRTTATMVERNFSDVAECVRQQSQRSGAGAATVEQLSGVSDVSANVIVTLREGKRSRGRYEVALVKEEGTWRFDGVSPAPEG